MEDFIADVTAPLTDQLALLPGWLLAAAWLAVLCVAGCRALRTPRPFLLSMSAFLRFPSVVVPIVLGSALFVFAPLGNQRGVLRLYAAELTAFSPLTLFAVAATPVAYAAVVLAVRVRVAKAPSVVVPAPAPFAQGERREELAELLTWAGNDNPVDDPAHDFYGHDALAKRIAVRIAGGSEENTAVVGHQGCGKTTVMRLVRHHLQQEQNVLFVSVTLWPFDSVEAAVSGVLRALTRALGERVSVLPIAGLADEYVAAVEGAGGWWGALGRAARAVRSPGDIIDALSNAAVTAGYRLVLWVEDFERFSGGERQDLGPLRALLHALDGRDNILVVVAGTSLDTRFDLEKIARHIVRVPGLRGDRGWAELHRYRQCALGGHPRVIIDPLPEVYRRQIAYDALSWIESQQSPGTKVIEPGEVYRHVLTVVQTPRMLKALIRLTDAQWRDLAGEVDFDAILVANTLRLRCPALFAVVEAHTGSLRHGLEKESQSTGMAGNLLQRAVTDLDPSLQVSVQNLLYFLFPGYAFDMTTRDVPAFQLPQGFVSTEPTDYWLRYLAASPVVADQSDQAILARIEEWVRTPEMRILEPWQGSRPISVLTAMRSQRVIEYFPRFFADWCHEAARHNSRPGHHKWFLQNLDEFLDPLSHRADCLRSDVASLVAEHAETDLGLAAEIAWWTHTLDEATGASARSAVCEGLFAICRSKNAVARLVGALHSDSRGLLGIAIDPVLPPGGSHCDRIETIRAALLDAAQLHPDKVFASLTRAVVWDFHVAKFRPPLVSVVTPMRDDRFVFLLDRLEKVFGNRLPEVTALVKEWVPSDSLDEQILGMARFWVRNS